jgi:lysozyme
MRHIKSDYREIARNMLIRHEDLKTKPYKCTAGKLTIGVGRNLDDNGIRKVEAYFMLDNDIDEVIGPLKKKYGWFERLNAVRKAVIIDMAFNLGIPRFGAFKKTIALIESGQYEEASREMLNSKWAVQVGYRAKELSEMMRSGELREK